MEPSYRELRVKNQLNNIMRNFIKHFYEHHKLLVISLCTWKPMKCQFKKELNDE